MVSVSKLQRALIVFALVVNGWMYMVWTVGEDDRAPGFALAGALPLIPLLAGRRTRSFVGLTLAVAAFYAAGWGQYWTEDLWSGATFIQAILLTPGAFVLIAAAVAPRRLPGPRDAAAQTRLGLGVAVVALLVLLAVTGALADVQFDGGLPEADVE